ncbi:MAG: LysM peptidoglycan-binding domain-containing protein [Chloroflexota bacterium]
MFVRYMMWLPVLLLLAACAGIEGTSIEEESLETPITVGVTVQPTEVVNALTAEDIQATAQSVDDALAQSETVATQVSPVPTTQVAVASANTGTTIERPSDSPADCTVRTDLPVHTVIGGDTLSSIALAYDSTVADLTVYNCLDDGNLISVGQQLYVPLTVEPTPTPIRNDDNTPNQSESDDVEVVGELTISPADYTPTAGYLVHDGNAVTLTWTGIPEGLDIAEVVFVYASNDTPTSYEPVGIDNLLSDGVSTVWQPHTAQSGTIRAVARLSGQSHTSMQSPTLNIDILPVVVGPLGALGVGPNIQAGTPDDWGDYVVEAGTTVTVSWTGVDPEYFYDVTSVEFAFYPDAGGEQILGMDTDFSDGTMTVSWAVPGLTAGEIVATGVLEDGTSIYSPSLHVRTPDSEADTGACQFSPSANGDVPMLPTTDLESTPITYLQFGSTYAVISKSETWWESAGRVFGQFYQIEANGHTGWVQDSRGQLIGDCSSLW